MSKSRSLRVYAQVARFSSQQAQLPIIAIGIHRLGWGHRKLGVACPIISFLHKTHYRNNLYIYINDFRLIQKSYLAMLGPSGSFLQKRARRAFTALKCDRDRGIENPA